MTTPTATLLPERVAALDTLTLARWSPGRKAGQTMGVMESAAWVAGEPHSDTPACVSPVLGAFLRELNEELDDEERQALKPYVTRIVGTGGDGHDKARAYLALDWLVRVHAPAWLDLAGLGVEAATLRGLPRTVDRETAEAAGTVAATAKSKAVVAHLRGPLDASSASRDAALDAAWASCCGAANAIEDGRHTRGVTAARDVAWAAAKHSAWAAAKHSESAVGAPFGLTITALQTSTLDLLDRMIDPAAAV